MSDIGGYYSTLTLNTDGESFEKARRYFASITNEAHTASEAMDELQESIKKKVQGAFASARSSKPNEYVQKAGFKMNPESGYMVDDSEARQEKSAKKKDQLTQLASLYAVIKLVKMLANVTEALAKLTYALTRDTMKTVIDATKSGLTANEAKMWGNAAFNNGADPKEMVSSLSALNKAFVELKLGGSGEDFGRIAQDISIMSSMGGKQLDPASLLNMTNGERAKAIFDLANSVYDKNQAEAIRLLTDAMGEGAASIMIGQQKSGVDQLARGKADILVEPTARDLKIGQDISETKTLLDETGRLLAQAMGEEFQKDIEEFNKWLRENGPYLKRLFQGLAGIFHLLMQAFEMVIGIFKGVYDAIYATVGEIDRMFPQLNLFSESERKTRDSSTEAVSPSALDVGERYWGLRGNTVMSQGSATTINVYSSDPRLINSTINGILDRAGQGSTTPTQKAAVQRPH